MDRKKADQIMQKIKRENVHPESVWQIRWKSYLLWLVWLGVVIFGAFATALVLLNILELNVGVLRALGVGKFLGIFIQTAPYLWFGMLILSGITGYMVFRQTRNGYRYASLFVGSLTVLLIALLAFFLHVTRVDRHIEEGITKQLGKQQRLFFPHSERWNQSEMGMMGGVIVEKDSNSITIANMRRGVVKVYISEQTRIERGIQLKKGMHVRVVGDRTGGDTIDAKFIQVIDKRHLYRKGDVY